MSNDLVINPNLATSYCHNQLPFALPNKDIRSSSLRVTNQMSLLQMAGSISATKMPSVHLGAALNSIRSSQKSIIFYSKLFGKINLTSLYDSPSHLGRGRGLGPEGGFDLDSFRLCAAVSPRKFVSNLLILEP